MKNKKIGLLFLAATSLTLSTVAEAQLICVYDLLGSAGDQYNMAKDFAIAAQGMGAKVQLKSYTDENIATQEFIAGQCDGLIATGLRTRKFNSIAGSLDALGVSTILRNGKVDMPASYDVIRKTIQVFNTPAGSKMMTNGNYEVAGIFPFGTAYPVVNDRNIKTVEALAGKKIAAFDYDKAQAIMIQKIGAQPISADITNFAGKFNNGSVDMIAAPAAAYRPLELYRGIGTKGAVNRFPILILTYQFIINKSKFSDDFAEKSRSYWLSQFDRSLGLINKAEKDIPASAWGELTPENSVKYTLMFRDARITIADQGVYDKRGLKIIKRVRCSINASDSECNSPSENW